MPETKIEIKPSTKVYDLLNAYPELEETLIGIAPPFKKLRNPVLRKSIGKIATLKNVSSVGNIPLSELINKIQKAVGQAVTDDHYEDEEYFKDKPDWFSTDRITVSINEEKSKNKNQMTIVAILKEVKNLKEGEIIELITTFLPAPGIDTMKSKNYSVWTVKEKDNLIKSYFLKNTD
jgi:TusA-related sulfurtransferase